MKIQTLEEAANKANGYNVYAKETKAPIFNEGFIEGAKWQQKKMFTEEQLAIAMLDFGLYIAENRGKPIDTDNKIKEIIEQFKQQEQ
jgi:fructose-1,6-bisphosphatase